MLDVEIGRPWHFLDDLWQHVTMGLVIVRQVELVVCVCCWSVWKTILKSVFVEKAIFGIGGRTRPPLQLMIETWLDLSSRRQSEPGRWYR